MLEVGSIVKTRRVFYANDRKGVQREIPVGTVGRVVTLPEEAGASSAYEVEIGWVGQSFRLLAFISELEAVQ